MTTTINKVYIDSHGILQILVVGDQTADSVREMGEKVDLYIRQLCEQHKPVVILDNLTHMGRTTSEARREVARLARTLYFERGAMVGDGSPLMRYGTNLMLKAIGRSNLRYFGNLESAQKWLLAKKQV
jgi:hypothetical protein